MSFRSLAALTVPGVLAVTSVAGAPGLHAQTATATATPVASQLGVLSHNRAVRWATAGHVLHCGPAPLTERPGIQSEFARPRVAPLESAFADAARVKRSVASLRMKNQR